MTLTTEFRYMCYKNKRSSPCNFFHTSDSPTQAINDCKGFHFLILILSAATKILIQGYNALLRVLQCSL